MKRWQISIIIDALMFVFLSVITGLGLLIKYLLLPGEKSKELYGVTYKFTWSGLDRHEWGTIKLYLALFFLLFLILHIVLHWTTIKNLFGCLVPSKPAALILIISILGFSFRTMVKPEFGEPRGMGKRQGMQFRK